MIQGVLIGAGAMLAISFVVAAWENTDRFRDFLRFLLGVVVAPFLLVAIALQATRAGATRISPQTLSRFALQRTRDGKAWALFYGNRGWIYVGGLKHIDPPEEQVP